MPEAYAYEPTPSAFVEHVGRVFTKKVTRSDGTVEAWSALRIEPHHERARRSPPRLDR